MHRCKFHLRTFNDIICGICNIFFRFYSQYLNISQNDLVNIEQNAFEDLNHLKILDLSLNRLKTVIKLALGETVEHISLAGNQLKYWPLKSVPTNLQTLELQENELIELIGVNGVGKKKIALPFLKFLNISSNRISSLPIAFNFTVLEVFDGSYNKFTTIPPYLGIQAPKLKVVKLRGNPIKTIEFITKISAHHLDLSELSLLTEFDASTFNSIGLYLIFMRFQKYFTKITLNFLFGQQCRVIIIALS